MEFIITSDMDVCDPIAKTDGVYERI